MPLQFFYVGDLCRFIETLLKLKPKQKIFNVGNSPVTIREWVEACYSVIGKTPTFISVSDKIEQRKYFPFYNYAYMLDVSVMNELLPDLMSLKKGLQRAYNWYKYNKCAVNSKNYFEFIKGNLNEA